MLNQIAITDLDRNLYNDIDNLSDFKAYAYGSREYQIVYSDLRGRGGIVYIGSGSSGETFWTDANSAEDVLLRFFDDDMSA